MDLKRVSAAALALAMAASVPAFAAGENYETVLSVNGTVLESFDFSREVEGWGSETVTRLMSELAAAPAGYVPMRAIAQADHGSCYWDKEGNQAWFQMSGHQIDVSFEDFSVTVNEQPVEGVSAVVLGGFTYLPVSVFEGLEGCSVADNSADGVESYEITTPNGTPLMKLAYEIADIGEMGAGMKSTPEDLELFQGEATGFKAEFMTEGVGFLPMMTSPDTVILGKAAEGKLEDLKAALEAYRKTQEETFSWYLSHNLPKVQDARFVTEGDWFLFYIGDYADDAVAAFQSGADALE